jgi:hypothetical protein
MNLAVEDAALERRIIARFAEALAGCTAVPEPKWGNVLLFGTVSTTGHGLEERQARASELAKKRGIPFALGKMARTGTSCRDRLQPLAAPAR